MASIKMSGEQPAFPTNDKFGSFYRGITIRDYFAGQALMGLVSSYSGSHDTLAKDSYRFAEAMLREREKDYD